MPRTWFIICALLILTTTISVSARDVLSQDICVVEEDESIDGTLFAFCEELYIAGIVNGDVFGATVRTEITGTVTGSLYMIGGQLDIKGTVAKDIHYGGAVLRFNPEDSTADGNSDVMPTVRVPRPILTTRSIKALTLSTTLNEASIISDGLLNVGYQLIIDGTVEEEVSFWGSALIINGIVDDNVYAIVGNPESDSSQIETLLLPLRLDLQLVNPGLIITDTGSVTGLLSYRGPVEGSINGILEQEPNYRAPDVSVLEITEPGFFSQYIEVLGSSFSTLLIIGMLILFLINGFLNAPLANLRTRPFASLGVGLLGFLLSFPIVLIIVVLSLSLLGFLFILGFRGVVFAIAIVLGLVNIGGVSIFYFVAIFITRAIVGLALGRLILRVIFQRNDVDEHRWLQYLALAVGVFVIATLISLPIIGVIVNAVALFLGLGAILIFLTAQFERFRNAPTPAPAWYRPSPAIIREHRVNPNMEQATLPADQTQAMRQIETDDVPQLPGPGATNLPKGFDWSFFED